jgi:hypothetical protein
VVVWGCRVWWVLDGGGGAVVGVGGVGVWGCGGVGGFLLRSNIPRSALCATLDTYNLILLKNNWKSNLKYNLKYNKEGRIEKAE